MVEGGSAFTQYLQENYQTFALKIVHSDGIAVGGNFHENGWQTHTSGTYLRVSDCGNYGSGGSGLEGRL